MKESTFQELVIHTLLFLVKAQGIHGINTDKEHDTQIALQDLEHELKKLERKA